MRWCPRGLGEFGKTLHDGFGTDNSKNLSRFIAGELTDVEFMRSDIAMWKAIQVNPQETSCFECIRRIFDEGCSRNVTSLQDAGVYVAIVSAGVDLFVSSLLLPCSKWTIGLPMDSNSMKMDSSDDGIYRLHAGSKGDVIID